MAQPVWRRLRKPLSRSVAQLTAASMAVSPVMATAPAFAKTETVKTATPIEHIVMIIGENHSFDNLYGTYIPKHGETIDNILSKKIVKTDGTPGANFSKAAQMQGVSSGTYAIAPKSKSAYSILPPPRPVRHAGKGV